MNIFSAMRDEVVAALGRLEAAGTLPAGLDTSRVTAEPPKDAAHGDIATNAAMVLAKPAAMKPRDLADALAAELRGVASVTEVAVAGPGFINLRLADDFWRARLGDILRAGTAYGDSDLGRGEPVNVEYVSANPTGPLHVGHGRGAVFGDALANLLAKVGFAVTREYYINDAGAQVDKLARTNAYMTQLLDDPNFVLPKDLDYTGGYMREIASKTLERVHETEGFSSWSDPGFLQLAKEVAVDENLRDIKTTLGALGVPIDGPNGMNFVSERTLVDAGKVDECLKVLESAGLVYTGTLEPPKGKLPEDWEERPQLLFRSTQFGDEVDRPLQKSDGSWTYFASDIAYHLDKFRRGFARMIDVWGADHGGYVKRVQAAMKALTEGKGRLDVQLVQLVSLLKDGQPFKMSKRAGDIVYLTDVVNEVGKDVVRFMMLTRKNDDRLVFDLAKVLEQSKDNPVFYVQYAHARARSVLRHAAAMFPGQKFDPESLAAAPLDRLTDPAEIALIRQLAAWPRLVEGAAEAEEPHRIAFYMYDLAASFHGLWTMGKDDAALRFLVEADPALSMARAALVQGLALVIASGLAVFGVEPKEEMR